MEFCSQVANSTPTAPAPFEEILGSGANAPTPTQKCIYKYPTLIICQLSFMKHILNCSPT